VVKAIPEVLRKVGDPGMVGLALLVALGLFVCFLGYRYFRFSAGVVGFIVGTELFGQLAMDQRWGSVLTAIVGLLGGAGLCALFVVFSFLAVFGLGALLACSLVGLAARAAHASLHPLSLVLAILIGGFAALLMRQFVVVVSTSLYGGLMAIASLFSTVKGRSVSAAVEMTVRPEQTEKVVLFLLCVAVLVTGGIVVQFRYGKNPQLDGK